MPTKAKKKSPAKRSHKMIDTMTEDLAVSPMIPSEQPALSDGKSKRLSFVIGAAVVLVVGGIYVLRSGMVVAAIVNGTPIYRSQLDQALMSRFGKQVYERIINEALIQNEAAKAKVTVTPQDIEGRVKEITEKFGGISLEDMLKFQGMTKDDFEKELKLQLTVEKLLGKDIVIKEEDIDVFIATSRAQLTATEEGKLRVEAKNAILSQKVSEKFQTWFSELRTKASVTNFIKL